MYFYSNDIIGYIPLPLLLAVSAILLLPFVLLSTSAALGLSFIRWRSDHILLGLLFVSYILPHVFILSEDRFHLALVPYIAILAAQFWNRGPGALSARWHESSLGKFVLMVAVLCVILLLTNWGLELTRDWDKIAELLGPNGNQSYFPY
jgi:ABC-type iron transport system FetAB permease component